MMRNTSPIGWVPLLFIKVFRDGAFLPFLISAVLVAAPIVLFSTFLDSYYYSGGLEGLEWTITGLNFIRVNVVEGLSKYFGDHPVWFYLLGYGPAMFTVVYPFVLWGMYFFAKEQLQMRRSPEMVYTTVFYFIVFSLIPHKEKRFLLPIFPFCVLALGYLLVRKLRAWGSKVTILIWLSVVVEFSVQGLYHFNHNSWRFTDYILSKGTHPHSFYPVKRYDQAWYSLFHTNEPGRKTKIYLSHKDPDWFRKKYNTNLNLALDRETQLCIELLANIEDHRFRPEYVLLEQIQCAGSLYCY
mmetsp:Transcript_11454/g.19374  ORF Transcript_11454/g.19374 Transcript_11454/m.19374 type:complete len:298 (-) Transcript_11454:283-1176(-)